MKSILALVAITLASVAHANEKNPEEPITKAANLLGDCSGFFAFMAEFLDQTQQPASATHMRDTAHGAMMAAAYMLSLEHAATGAEPRRIGTFSIYPEGRATANLNRMRALLEQKDSEGIQKEQQRCLAALPMQEEIVQMMRNTMIDRGAHH